MYQNDFNDDGIERRPSNLDRDAKLNYQSHLNSKKRVKDKIETLNSGVFQGGFNKNKFTNANNLLPSPRHDYFETNTTNINRNSIDNNFVSQSNLEFMRKYEIEEIEPQKIHEKLKNANKRSKKQYVNEGYQKEDIVESKKPEKYIPIIDKNQEQQQHDSRKKSSRSRNLKIEEDDEVEEITVHHNNVASSTSYTQQKVKTNFISNSEIMGDQEQLGAIAPVNLYQGKPNIEKTNNNNVDIDYSIFDFLNNKNTTDFILKPAPIGLVIKCQVYRHKGLYPEYKMCLQREDASIILILSAKKRKRTKTPCYLINTVSLNGKINVEVPFAKLKSNLIGTQFTLYDNGNDDDTQSISKNENVFRKEYVSVLYGLNVLGFKGPRQMKGNQYFFLSSHDTFVRLANKNGNLFIFCLFLKY
jgi:hypothetical protein